MLGRLIFAAILVLLIATNPYIRSTWLYQKVGKSLEKPVVSSINRGALNIYLGTSPSKEYLETKCFFLKEAVNIKY